MEPHHSRSLTTTLGRLVPLLFGSFAACTTPSPQFEVSQASTQVGGSISWVGQTTTLEGEGRLKVGETLPTVSVVNLKMKSTPLPGREGVKIISTLPSLDTPVCDVQTHALSEAKGIDPRVERITVSSDLPYAIRRFRESSKLENISYFSDFRDHELGQTWGLRVSSKGVLARALVVVDQQNKVRHLQIVPEILTLPDLKKAIDVANELVAADR